MQNKPEISIGYLPILDHLTLGVTQRNDAGSFEHCTVKPVLFSNWIEVADALTQGKLQAAFLLAPLVLELCHQGQELKVVLLGHREGQVLVVRNSIKTLSDLVGKKVFIPHRFSTHHLLLRHLLTEEQYKSIKFVDEPFPLRSLPDQMATGVIDAFITAEPMGTEVKKRKIGYILKNTQDIIPHIVDCVLVMRNDFVVKQPAACAELVQSLVRSGMSINTQQRHAAEIGESFLNWPKKVLLEALSHDRGHILFWDLLPRTEDFVQLQTLGIAMGLWKETIELKDIVYPKFAHEAYREWIIGVRQTVKDKGEKRTLPATFGEGVARLEHILGESVGAVGLQFVRSGDHYPKGIDREKKPIDLRPALDLAFGGKEFVVPDPTGSAKGIALLDRKTSYAIGRVVLRLSTLHAERCVSALNFGQDYTVQEAVDWNTFAQRVAKDEKGVVILKEVQCSWLSLDYHTFCFLVLLLDSQ